MAFALSRGARPKGFAIQGNPRAVPEVRFVTASGAPKTLDTFRGKMILLNLWATWCLPCIKEMPSLDALQADMGGRDFEVVALSVDDKGVPAAQRFLPRSRCSISESALTGRCWPTPTLP